ncbi:MULTISPECIES: histidine--tRNA ligase [Actinotignum]|uniref:Histidine--tRNA ligase n=1 Tax=Actinotignum timonense TaxID=1870995 RepID=A0AAW9HJA9_9ACTO|nr:MULTISPECIES: histidine--tRNA ligase [Actinotignum]MDE1535554.1 histidine--tRNA ligase [Actinotignum schaalii]MDE1558084.1 histidine--tRNA ligase [Actinotignum schaalii]MDE1662458.1 histidine--tRNA ligase [Actinotignum schaalii]MDK6373052.1 histidine--tRNA ligase [Actinotignum timonense]MDK6419041.1 histidine--tRNA ligase [Actinotignum timonense]
MKIAPISGFPEWLPQARIVEQKVLDTLRSTFELHGFSGVETRAVEPMDQLLRKGETSKEVYVLRRLQGEEGQDSGLGLHFDLTVPLARYVLENAGKLDFPFKRYQIQKVWRGERPQDGRFREFYQADVDVVGQDTLAFHHDIELPLVMVDALSKLPIPRVRVRASNRKLAQGFYEAIGLENTEETLRILDKLDKVGPQVVTELLSEHVGASEEQAKLALSLAGITTEDASFVDKVRALGASSSLLEEGLEELATLVTEANSLIPGSVSADLSIARGLDYYTGSVFESTVEGHEDLGSVCSGGRYDNLATAGNRSYPGVGLSIGVSRLLARFLHQDLLRASRKVPTAVYVAVNDESERHHASTIAARLRARGIPADVSHNATKFGKQIKAADKRGIPFVWFTTSEGEQVRDVRSGTQVPADPDTWTPPEEDRFPRVIMP